MVVGGKWSSVAGFCAWAFFWFFAGELFEGFFERGKGDGFDDGMIEGTGDLNPGDAGFDGFYEAGDDGDFGEVVWAVGDEVEFEGVVGLGHDTGNSEV